MPVSKPTSLKRAPYGSLAMATSIRLDAESQRHLTALQQQLGGVSISLALRALLREYGLRLFMGGVSK